MLQFGHSLTAVENRGTRGWQPASQPGWLQFGHSLTAVENGLEILEEFAPDQPDASIWPQPHSRGEPADAATPIEQGASIWPQPHSRGEPDTRRRI